MRTSTLTENPTPIENYHLVYRRLARNHWQFVGYRCLNCDRVIRNDVTVPKHSQNCKKHERIYKIDPDPIKVLNKHGNDWEPFEMIQVSALPEFKIIEKDK